MGGKAETVTDFIFLGSKITADGERSHGIIRCLFLGRKAMTNLNSVLKSGDITLPTKVRIVKLVFLHGESPWTEEPGGLLSIVSHRVGHD